MIDESAARNETLARLAATRAEICRIFEPPPDSHSDSAGSVKDGGPGVFPRSRTMRVLLSGRGVGTVGALVGGLLMARPALAFRLLRLLPKTAVARVLLSKAMSTLRARRG